MKRKNILTPGVKEIHLKNDTIQVEKVSFYESVDHPSRQFESPGSDN